MPGSDVKVDCARTLRIVVVGAALWSVAACSGGADDAGDAPATAPTKPASVAPTAVTTAPTTVPAAATSAPPTTVAAADGPVVTSLPRAGIDVQVPPVEGFTYVPEPEQAVPWLQLALPSGGRGLTIGVREGGVPIGSLVVVDGISHSRYVDELFDEPVDILRDATDSSAGTVYLTNTTLARWQALSGVPVVAATLPDVGIGQWVWRKDDLTWIAVGTTALERWAAGVVAAQQAIDPAGTHDYSELGGTLYAGLPVVHPYLYVDAPVVDTLTSPMQTLSPGCARQLYTGSVVAVDDPAPLTGEPADLVLHAMTIGGHCRDQGWFSALDAELAAQGFVQEVIGDVPVRRRDDGMVVVDGDDVEQFSSADPATFVAMAPFITSFVTGELPPDVTDDTRLPVGTCLFRAPSSNGDDVSRHTFAVGCAEPHQGEVFHRFDLTVPPGDAYPGDAEASRLAAAGCDAAFATFVGIPHDASRLEYLYYYPSADTWEVGERAVMCIVHGNPDELFRTSLAGSRQ